MNTMGKPDSPEATQLLFEYHICNANIDELVSLYERDGVVIQKDGQLRRGEQQIREHLDQLLKLKPKISNNVLHCVVVENIAMIFSQWQLTGVSPEGAVIEASGRSFDVLSRQADGSWLIAIDSPYGHKPEFV